MPEITPSKYMVTVGWDQTPHLTEQAKAELLASTPPHLRAARSRGEPSMGVGAVYPVPLDDILCDPFVVPEHWPRVYGFDVGWNRTAGIWLAHDRQNDTVFGYSEYYRGQAEPTIHVAAVKARGDWIPGVIDPASVGASVVDGRRLSVEYRNLGLILTNANNDVEAGILAVFDRLGTGRLKIFRTLQNFCHEYLNYRRDERGKPIKAEDHLLDALR